MTERTYMVCDNHGYPMAQKMDLKTALILIEALVTTYYKDFKGWTIITDYSCTHMEEDNF